MQQVMEVTDHDIKRFQETILKHSGYDFSEYTVNSLRRRLTKILEGHDHDMDKLLAGMASDSDTLESVVKKLMVSTTELFRDPAIWRKIMFRVLPGLGNRSSLNIWHPGCSTGQEVYSMMIILHHLDLLDKTNLFATDINSDALEVAKKGEYRYRFNKVYLENFNQVFCAGEGEDRECYSDWKKYMRVDETHDVIRMREFLRKKPQYLKFDLVKDRKSFDVEFDIIVCRNVIIYFNYELQNRVLSLLHERLDKKGCLVLGVHESIIGPCAGMFRKEENIYFRK